MTNLYPYLIASLPMLHFGMKLPFSYEQFIEICCPLIPEKDSQILQSLPQPEQYMETGKKHRIIQKWVEFDTALRNELVRIRAARKHVDPATFMRPEGYTSTILTQAQMATNTAPSLLEAEKTLDETRWKALEDLATGHYLDLDFLITYAYKLLILQRWEAIRNADGLLLLEHALQHEQGIYDNT